MEKNEKFSLVISYGMEEEDLFRDRARLRRAQMEKRLDLLVASSSLSSSNGGSVPLLAIDRQVDASGNTMLHYCGWRRDAVEGEFRTFFPVFSSFSAARRLVEVVPIASRNVHGETCLVVSKDFFFSRLFSSFFVEAHRMSKRKCSSPCRAAHRCADYFEERSNVAASEHEGVAHGKQQKNLFFGFKETSECTLRCILPFLLLPWVAWRFCCQKERILPCSMLEVFRQVRLLSRVVGVFFSTFYCLSCVGGK